MPACLLNKKPLFRLTQSHACMPAQQNSHFLGRHGATPGLHLVILNSV